MARRMESPITGSKQSLVKLDPHNLRTEFIAARPRQLFDLLSDRLTLSDSLKDRLSSLSPSDHLYQAETMISPPESAAEREFYGEMLWANICDRFAQELSPLDRSLWLNPPKDPSKSTEHLRLLHSFDVFLLDQFVCFGPALLMSYDVLRRVFAWRVLDPQLHSRLGAALKLNARIARGEPDARFPITKELGAFKPQAKKELRTLFKKVRDEFARRNPRDCTPKAIVDWIESAIKSQPRKVFVYLGGSLPQLKEFLLAEDQEGTVLGIVTGRTRPAAFVDTWLARATGYSVERARQEASKSRL